MSFHEIKMSHKYFQLCWRIIYRNRKDKDPSRLQHNVFRLSMVNSKPNQEINNCFMDSNSSYGGGFTP